MTINEMKMIREVWNNNITAETLARLGWKIDWLLCVSKHERVMPDWSATDVMVRVGARRDPFDRDENFTEYKDVAVPVLVSSRRGYLGKIRANKLGARYQKVRTSKGWKTSYVKPEDARTVVRALEVRSETRALKKWLGDRAVFNH